MRHCLTNCMFGLEPVWLHACNVLLHALSCVLFTRLSFAVAGLSRKFSAVAGILFAVHPIHSDACSLLSHLMRDIPFSSRVSCFPLILFHLIWVTVFERKYEEEERRDEKEKRKDENKRMGKRKCGGERLEVESGDGRMMK
ncbi:hypothetical protein M8J77_000884 [Diaphorina citri]|nr:hypothetical protein M8J77_000884 [Diaphorina citri]